MSKVTDLSPDHTRPGIPDVLARNLFFRGAMTFFIDGALIGDETSSTLTSTLRIKEVQVATQAASLPDAGQTAQVQINGRDIFADDDRPVSLGDPKRPTYPFIATAGSTVTVVLDDALTAPRDFRVNIITEPTTLLPHTEQRELRGRDRLRTSKRREVAASNSGVDVSPLFPTAVNVPYPIGPGVTSHINTRLIRVRGQDIHFRPRR